MRQPLTVIQQLLLLMLAGWINRRQQAQIDFLKGENRTLKECLKQELGERRLPLNDVQRRRLAELGKPLGRKLLGEVAGLVTPDTILFGERSLRHVLEQYLAHDHGERNHQGLGNRLIEPGPEVGQSEGEVVRKERLGGLLAYYYRKAA